jgi:hypothetical protein
MKIDGRCHCGAIAYEADIDPAAMTICHCTDCQMLSGSAFRANIACAPGSFRLTRGTPKSYVRIADSGTRRRQGFCATCGTQLYACPDEAEPQIYSLRSGTIAQRAQLKPARQIWLKSKMAWIDDIAAVPGLEGDRKR